MMPTETTSCPSVPATSGTIPSRPWTCCRSELARETTCPVRSASCLGPSRRETEPNTRRRRSCWTPSESRPAEVAAQEGRAEADDGDGGHRDHEQAEPRGGARRRRGRPPCAISSGPTASRLTPEHRGGERGHGERRGGASSRSARRRTQPRARPVGTSSRAGTRSVVRSVVPSGEVVVDGRPPPRLGRHPDSPPRRATERPEVTNAPASWSNTPVRQLPARPPLGEPPRARVRRAVSTGLTSRPSRAIPAATSRRPRVAPIPPVHPAGAVPRVDARTRRTTVVTALVDTPHPRRARSPVPAPCRADRRRWQDGPTPASLADLARAHPRGGRRGRTPAATPSRSTPSTAGRSACTPTTTSTSG